VLAELTAAGSKAVLFIDDIHAITGPNAQQGGGVMDASVLLKPLLARWGDEATVCGGGEGGKGGRKTGETFQGQVGFRCSRVDGGSAREDGGRRLFVCVLSLSGVVSAVVVKIMRWLCPAGSSHQGALRVNLVGP
jgi:hypothetical protein